MVEIIEQALEHTLKTLVQVLGALLDKLQKHTWEEPNRKHGVPWTILAWIVGLCALALAIKAFVFVVLAGVALYVMNNLPKPKLKARAHYKSRRK